MSIGPPGVMLCGILHNGSFQPLSQVCELKARVQESNIEVYFRALPIDESYRCTIFDFDVLHRIWGAGPTHLHLNSSLTMASCFDSTSQLDATAIHRHSPYHQTSSLRLHR